MALTFLTTATPNKAALVNEFLKDVMALARHLVQQRHFRADYVLQHILRRIWDWRL
jgi:hypothetical protein